MNKLMMVGALGMLTSTTGCAGIAFGGHGVPYAAVYAQTSTVEHVTQNPQGDKVGTACASSILGIATVGDASANTAAKRAGITTISAVDNTHMNVLGIVARYCVKVSGS